MAWHCLISKVIMNLLLHSDGGCEIFQQDGQQNRHVGMMAFLEGEGGLVVGGVAHPQQDLRCRFYCHTAAARVFNFAEGKVLSIGPW